MALCAFPLTVKLPQKLLIKGYFNRHLSSVVCHLSSYLLNFSPSTLPSSVHGLEKTLN
jgi:hypothetical protein